MKTKPSLLFALGLAALSGCASAARQHAVQTAIQLGTPTELVSKMERGDRLTLTDLETLARHQIPDAEMLAYLRQTDAAYELTMAQIDRMRAAGVSVKVIDYLLATPRQGIRRYRGYYGGGFGWYGYGHGGFGHGFPRHGRGHGSIHHGGHH
jgi:hypothetical protein